MTNPPNIHITYMLGSFEAKPPTYRLTRNSDGTGRLDSEYASLVGGYDDLLQSAAMVGIHISSFDDDRSGHLELPPHSNSFWGSLKECFLDLLFGPYQRKVWRIEQAHREYAEALNQRHLDAARNLAAQGDGIR